MTREEYCNIRSHLKYQHKYNFTFQFSTGNREFMYNIKDSIVFAIVIDRWMLEAGCSCPDIEKIYVIN